MVVDEFNIGDSIISPRSGIVFTQDLKVCFDFLVYLFHFSVRLGVISSGEEKVIFQEFSEFSSEGGYELRTLIKDDFVIEAEVEVYFVEKEGNYPFSNDDFLHRAKNHPLSKPMVNHDQKEIKAGGHGKVSDKIEGDLLEGA